MLKTKKGISLISLIIIVIVIIILAGAMILSLKEGGLLDKAKKSKFMSDFRSIQEGVNVYQMSNLLKTDKLLQLPLEGKLSLDDKIEISKNTPTLKAKIEELNPGKTLSEIPLYWVNESIIGANNISKEKKNKGYIIDISNNQIYDYIGDFFEGLRWHTLDNGVEEIEKPEGDIQELWDGWIRLTLYYPKNSISKQWRLGSEGELRSDPLLMWQDYNGPITIPLDRVKDVWIKYIINNQEVIVPPVGTLLVDIVPDNTGTILVNSVNVKINYDESATLKEYRVGNSEWMPYTGQFVVTENCVIEARAKKTEDIYNADGSLLMSRDVAGSDKVYIGNIGMDKSNTNVGKNDLAAPIITRLPAQNSNEKARVKITYPSNANKKIYTINNGSEENYTQEISIQNWGTSVIGYYYDSTDKRSKAASIVINDTSSGQTEEQPKVDVPLENVLGDVEPAPTITRLAAQNGTEKARVKIDYPSNAVKKVYLINYGAEQTYTGEVSIQNYGTSVIAYYYDINGKKSKATSIIINDTSKGQEPEKPKPYDPQPTIPETIIKLPAPTITRLAAQNEAEKARVKVDYPSSANIKVYTINGGAEQIYTGEISINNYGTNVIAYYYDADGNKSQAASLLINDTSKGQEPEKPEDYNPKTGVTQKAQPAPVIIRLDAQNSDEKAKVQIFYPENAVRKIYKMNLGVEQGYSSDISIKTWGTNIVAYYYDANGNISDATELTINDTSSGDAQEPTKPYEPLSPNNPGVPKPEPPKTNIDLVAPTLTRLNGQNANEKARVNVDYLSTAVRKVYTINFGSEVEYTNTIPIYGWGTTVIAYYYDADGNRSKAGQLVINDTSAGQDPKEEEPYTPLNPDPKDYIAAPTINITPTNITSSVSVSVNSPSNADKTYIKVGKYGEYKEYNGAEIVTDNLEVFAYYRTTGGEKSVEARAKIDNIKKVVEGQTNNKPYLAIDAIPYPWTGSYGAADVNITLKYNSADKVEYSEDGLIYKPYTNTFKVTKNERVYARATNSYGVTDATLDITNIGNLVQPEPMQNISISINAQPDPLLSSNKVNSVNVSIDYDSKATQKYYSIGKNGDIKPYVGPFNVTSNCTIYAYALGNNAKGETSKTIDNLLNGISDPVIMTDPISSKTASKVTVNIQYDKYATLKKYSINGGPLQNYTSDFEVTQNNTTIYAYSENGAGQKSESTYVIQNIIPELPIVLLDKGDYYLLKLNYPSGSITREYKWKVDGEWKTYKDDGILLIKPQFKNKVLKNGTLIKIEDDNGNKITYVGDYYLLDVPISQVFENVFMRWDRTAPKAPRILINPTDASKSIQATIVYEDGLIAKQYRILEPGGTLGEWQDYTGPITINKNNTIIYARGMDDSELWSAEGSYKVTNIDEIAPTITLTADTTTSAQKVPVTIKATDDFTVSKVKWSQGIQGESYFKTNGTEILNNAVFNILENGYYTFYAEDEVGNSQVYTLNVQNIDIKEPGVILGTPSSTNIYEGDTITIPLQLSDDLSGINENTVTTINIIAVKSGVTSAAVTISGTGNNRTITVNNIWGVGNFYIQITGIKDNAGNVISKPIISSTINVDKSIYYELYSPMDYGTPSAAYSKTKSAMNSEQTTTLNQIKSKDSTSTYLYTEKDSNSDWTTIGYANGDISNNLYYYDRYTYSNTMIGYEEGAWVSLGSISLHANNYFATSYGFNTSTGIYSFFASVGGGYAMSSGKDYYASIQTGNSSGSNTAATLYKFSTKSGGSIIIQANAYSSTAKPVYGNVRGSYVDTVVATNSTYPDNGVSGTYWYVKTTKMPKYQIFKSEKSTLNLLSKYNIENNVLTSSLINLTKVQNSVKILVNASSTNYKFYISTDNTNWTEITDKNQLNGTTVINLPNASDKMYIKVDNISTVINNIKILKVT